MFRPHFIKSFFVLNTFFVWRPVFQPFNLMNSFSLLIKWSWWLRSCGLVMGIPGNILLDETIAAIKVISLATTIRMTKTKRTKQIRVQSICKTRSEHCSTYVSFILWSNLTQKPVTYTFNAYIKSGYLRSYVIKKSVTVMFIRCFLAVIFKHFYFQATRSKRGQAASLLFQYVNGWPSYRGSKKYLLQWQVKLN